MSAFELLTKVVSDDVNDAYQSWLTTNQYHQFSSARPASWTINQSQDVPIPKVVHVTEKWLVNPEPRRSFRETRGHYLSLPIVLEHT